MSTTRHSGTEQCFFPLGLRKDVASRRFAVELAGVASRLVPSRGHAALIPDASGLYFVPGLRAALAHA
jgi:hypothetical protein